MTDNANNPSNTSSGQQSHGDPTSTPPANVAPSASHGDQSSQPSPNAEELERKLAEVMKENADYRKKAREREAAAAAAEEQRKKEQGEFEALAKQYEARVKELEPKVAQFEAMAAKLKKQIQTATKEWPSEVKAFYPGDGADIDQIQDWYDRSQPLIERMNTQARGAQPGNGPNPRPAGSSPDDTQKVYLQRLRASGKYGA